VPKRDKLFDTLKEWGITAGVHYKPLYKYPIFPQTELPNTEKVWKEIISLPMHVELTENDIIQVCEVVNNHV
jgi:dTDP-4-amino-4,6-dideoxygalactose transaminase